MITLSDRISAYVERMDAAEQGNKGSPLTFRVACTLVWGFGLSVEEAWPFMQDYNARCMPPWRDKELKRKLDKALNHAGHSKPRGWIHSKWNSEEAGQLAESAGDMPSLPPPEPTWPAPDLSEINAIVRKGFGLYDLWEASTFRLDDVAQQENCETVVRAMFPPGKTGQPLLSCGKTPFDTPTKPLSEWQGELHKQSFVVPTRMMALAGINEDGDLSSRCLDNTGKRERLVIECDFSKFARDGKTPTIWKPLIEGWEADAISIEDAGSAILWELTQLAALSLAVHSGGKSIHGWFDSTRREFMHTAVRLGADRATWTRCQLVRMPEGTRDNGMVQKVYFFGGQK